MAGAPICFERVFNSVFVDSFHYIAKGICLLILNVKVFFLSSIKKILYWRTAHHWRNRIISCRYISLLCSYSSFCSIWSLISIQGSRYCRCFIVMHGEVTIFLILKGTESNTKQLRKNKKKLQNLIIVTECKNPQYYSYQRKHNSFASLNITKLGQIIFEAEFTSSKIC